MYCSKIKRHEDLLKSSINETTTWSIFKVFISKFISKPVMERVSSMEYFVEFCELKYEVLINSVVKGRHASTEKESLEYMEVVHEEENKIDSRAFRIHPILPTDATYGHVPF